MRLSSKSHAVFLRKLRRAFSRVPGLPVLLLFLALAACEEAGRDLPQAADARSTANSEAGSGGRNGDWAERQPYLVLVSIDGFRWDYLDRFEAPSLNRVAASGVRARWLVPVFPTLTFPNHYSIATGLYPAHHGIVANNFPDDEGGDWYAYKDRAAVQNGRWYGGEPIWVAAEKHGMVSAAYFFVGTEAPVDGISPSHWFAFDADVPGEKRVDQVIEWLSGPAATRPHVITLYFEEVDVMSHRYGPGSPESLSAIAHVDSNIERLVQGIDPLPIRHRITLMIVSDHGQSSYKPDAPVLVLDETVDLSGFSVVDGGSYAFLFADDSGRERLEDVRDTINAAWDHGKAWLKRDVPASWDVPENSLFPEIIVQADPQYGVIGSADRAYIMTAGDHGWAPEFADMHGIFVAAGPRLPAGRVIDPVSAVDIYPLMREILGLPQIPVDGDPAILLPLLDSK